jgi:hypothetical protein
MKTARFLALVTGLLVLAGCTTTGVDSASSEQGAGLGAPSRSGFSLFATAFGLLRWGPRSTLHNERVPTPVWVQRTASWWAR